MTTQTTPNCAQPRMRIASAMLQNNLRCLVSNELIAELRSAAATLRTPHPASAHEQEITAELLERAARVLADHANSEPNLSRNAVPSEPGTYRLSCAETGYRSLVVHVRRNEAGVLVASAAGVGTETVTAMHRKLTQVHWEEVR